MSNNRQYKRHQTVQLVAYEGANGNVLNDGDTVTVIKDLKLKGNSSIKRGTIVKNIRLIHEPTDGIHDIDCKIDGFGAMLLKPSVVKKI
jgi:protein PhnA